MDCVDKDVQVLRWLSCLGILSVAVLAFEPFIWRSHYYPWLLVLPILGGIWFLGHLITAIVTKKWTGFILLTLLAVFFCFEPFTLLARKYMIGRDYNEVVSLLSRRDRGERILFEDRGFSTVIGCQETVASGHRMVILKTICGSSAELIVISDQPLTTYAQQSLTSLFKDKHGYWYLIDRNRIR